MFLLLIALAPNRAFADTANGNHNAYLFLLGLGPAEGPDVATAPNGSTVSLTGSGSFTAGPNKTATGSGPYTITTDSGTTSGTWTVTGILNFVSYGEAIPQGLPGAFGGELKLQVALSGGGTGVLTAFCVLGVPPAGHMEGITLVLGQGMNFVQSTGGQTVFLSA
jgi:hypothetical protein